MDVKWRKLANVNSWNGGIKRHFLGRHTLAWARNSKLLVYIKTPSNERLEKMTTVVPRLLVSLCWHSAGIAKARKAITMQHACTQGIRRVFYDSYVLIKYVYIQRRVWRTTNACALGTPFFCFAFSACSSTCLGNQSRGAQHTTSNIHAWTWSELAKYWWR